MGAAGVVKNGREKRWVRVERAVGNLIPPTPWYRATIDRSSYILRLNTSTIQKVIKYI